MIEKKNGRASLTMSLVLMAFLVIVCIGQTLATDWLEQKLLPSNPSGTDYFGCAVAISGNLAIAGAFQPTTTDIGFASVFGFDGSSWTEQATLVPSDGAPQDMFGYSVNISGQTVIVGSRGHDIAVQDEGAAYIYGIEGSDWVEQAKLIAGDPESGANFGYSVALAGSIAIVGAQAKDEGGSSNLGAAYIFRFDDPNWVQEAKLVPADGQEGDLFGFSVAATEDTVVVGAYNGNSGTVTNCGAAYVYTYTGSDWVLQNKLTADDGAYNDRFGWSVAISDDVIIVGAYGDDDNGTDAGSAYVFMYDGLNWVQEAKLLAPDGVTGDRFGFSVSVSGDTVLVGASWDDLIGTNSGSAYLFNYDGLDWNFQEQLYTLDGSSYDEFGWAVDIDGTNLLIGARGDDDYGSATGAAYAYWIENPAGQMMADIIAFFDAGVAAETITGIPKAKLSSDDREAAFREVLIEAQDLIQAELYAEGSRKLKAALRACDGDTSPPDYIEGDDVPTLAGMIDDLIIYLETL